MEKLCHEVLIKIFSYLPTKDLIHFLKAFDEYCFVLRERSVIQCLNLKDWLESHNMNVCYFIYTNTGYEYIQILNINRLYWIKLNDLRTLVSYLHKLQELHAVDTELGVRIDDIALYRKLKTLSVSVETNQLHGSPHLYFKCLQGLERLCLKINWKESDFEDIYNLFAAVKRVQELWIYDSHAQNVLNYERAILYLPNLKKIVIKSRRSLPVLDLASWGLTKIFQYQRCDFSVEATFEKLSLGYKQQQTYSQNFCNQSSPIEEAWCILKDLHCEMPWGPKNFKINSSCRCYLENMDQIPVEVLLKILSYLDTYDLLQFCEAIGSDYLLKEKYLTQSINLSRNFEFQNTNVYSLITNKLDFNRITVLNISYLYWIPAAQLRKLVKQLGNLKVLLALDTKLGMRTEDIDEYTNLKKIAVSVEDDHFEHSSVIASRKLKILKALCLKITKKDEQPRYPVYLFFREIKHLEELWIYDANESNYSIDYYQLVVILKQLKKIVIKSKVALPYYDFRCDGILPTFECRRSGSATEFVFEKNLNISTKAKVSIFDPRENEFEKSWDVFQNLHKDLPCGPKESKEILLKKDINNVYFEDLNFCHAVILCNSKYINAALQILLSRNSTKLKRLSFRSCLFQDTKFSSTHSKQTVETASSGFKRPRRGIKINSENHFFQSVANNIKSITELEILTCPGCTGETVLSAYPTIQTFESLCKLTLEVPLLMDGVFMKEMFMKCQHLKMLNLTYVGPNEKFTFNLCQNLKHAKNLRDFRLDCKDITLDRLLNCFCELEQKKLMRFFLKCDNLQHNGNVTDSILNFMKNNMQLVLFIIVAIKNTIKQNSSIQKILNDFKKGNPAKIFYIKNDTSLFHGVFPIPPAHHDIIFNSTNVSVINIDEF